MSTGFQREVYDRHFSGRVAVTEQQAAHPLLRDLYDRIASRALQAAAAAGDEVRVLEVGCGEGLLAAALHRVAAREGLALRYVGSDVSAEAVALARTQAPGEYDVGDATTVAHRLGSRRFDLVVAKNLLHHLDAPVPFLRGAACLLGPSGRFVAAEAGLGSVQAWLFSLLAPRRERLFFVSTRRRNHRALAAAGLRLVADEPFGWLPYELLLATRFDLPRRLLEWPPQRVAAARRLDMALVRRMPWLASYRVYQAARSERWRSSPC